jgi:hypothetical protein
MHWLFNQRAIATMSDVELDHAIEYHMSIYHGMIYEREARRVSNARRNKGKVAGNESQSMIGDNFVSTQDGVQFSPVANQASKKIRTRSVKVSQSSVASPNSTKGASTKAMSPEAIAALVSQLMKAGLSADQITALGKK